MYKVKAKKRWTRWRALPHLAKEEILQLLVSAAQEGRRYWGMLVWWVPIEHPPAHLSMCHHCRWWLMSFECLELSCIANSGTGGVEIIQSSDQERSHSTLNRIPFYLKPLRMTGMEKLSAHLSECCPGSSLVRCLWCWPLQHCSTCLQADVWSLSMLDAPSTATKLPPHVEIFTNGISSRKGLWQWQLNFPAFFNTPKYSYPMWEILRACPPELQMRSWSTLVLLSKFWSEIPLFTLYKVKTPEGDSRKYIQ